MPAGHTIHKTLEVDGDRLLCRNCGWVRAARKGGRPYCANAKRAYNGDRYKRRHPVHHAHRGPTCEICGTTEALGVDHDHSCCPGKEGCLHCIRGTLCRECNLAVAWIEIALQKGTIDQTVDYIRSRSLSMTGGN